MWIEELCQISRTDDGKFLVSIKQKRKENKKSDMVMAEADMKTFVADDEKDVAELLSKYLPKMKKGGTDEDAFNEGFDKAKK